MSTYGPSGFGSERKGLTIEDKVSEARTSVEHTLEEKKEDSRRMAEGLKKRANAVKETVKEKVAQGVEVLDQESVGDTVRRAKGYVKENPGKVVLASFAMGWLAGVLRLGRKHSKPSKP